METIEQGTAGGVSFGLTNEQKALRDLAHDFAEREIRPKEREYDEGSIHPADGIAKAHGLGLMNVHIPEAYGGLCSARSRACSSARSSAGAAPGSARQSRATGSAMGR